ncbi:MAG: hypothetical protein RIG62_13525 [Cyclobacteriaceae bacterium]
MKNFKFIALLPALLVFISQTAFAQGPPPPPDIPIDGGLAWLLAAGGVFGIKKIRDARIKNRQ